MKVLGDENIMFYIESAVLTSVVALVRFIYPSGLLVVQYVISVMTKKLSCDPGNA